QFLSGVGAGRGSGGVSHARPRSLPVRHPAGSRHRARLRGAEGSRGGALCRRRPTRQHQPNSHQHLSAGSRLPTMHTVREFVDAGGLMSYGPTWLSKSRRAADFVDKILRGTKPADLPIEQPTKFDLVINLTTAKALGLEVPPTLLARADEVI